MQMRNMTLHTNESTHESQGFSPFMGNECMVEVRRIELRSKANPRQVSPSSVTNYISSTAHLVTDVWYSSWFNLFVRHTNYVLTSISLK